MLIILFILVRITSVDL